MSRYSGVVTTGIYCVPECSARPLPRNVRPFESAADAEAAGFRSCHRCRPYRGTDPSHRAHFARRLLDDTDLGVADVAVAAGFGTMARLDAVLTDVFREPAAALRARRRRSDRIAGGDGVAMRLPFAAPLDWGALIGWLTPRVIDGVEAVDRADVYRRTVVVERGVGAIEVACDGEDHLVVRAQLPSVAGLWGVAAGVHRLCNLGADLATANRALDPDPIIGPLVRKRPGLRPPGVWDGFELGVRAIVGQQVSVAGASTVTARIVERLGAPVAGFERLGLRRRFPDPGTVADGDLAALGLTSARAEAIRTFARAVAAGDVPLDGSVPLDDLVARVSALRGLGAWTAHYLALRLGYPDAFPAGDLGLRRALLQQQRADPEPPTVRELDARAETWRPWRAHAATHLWASETSPETSAA